MHIAELIEIALANCDARRVEVAALEPAELAVETVSALSQLVSELVDNALAFSEEGVKVRVTGLFDQGTYLITVSDRGVGIPEHFMNALNRALIDPSTLGGSETNLGIALIARLAARHGIKVRLVAGVPGTTARVTIPSRLLADIEAPRSPKPTEMEIHRRTETRRLSEILRETAEEEFSRPARNEDAPAFTRLGQSPVPGSGVVAQSEDARRLTEEFLDRVFAPLARQPGMTERPLSRHVSNGRGSDREATPARRPPPTEPKTGATVTTLRRRVPGENFLPVEDDPSTMAAERAVDIRSALSKYSEGRKSAEEGGHDQAGPGNDEATPTG